jgi:hypothetical protein
MKPEWEKGDISRGGMNPKQAAVIDKGGTKLGFFA